MGSQDEKKSHLSGYFHDDFREKNEMKELRNILESTWSNPLFKLRKYKFLFQQKYEKPTNQINYLSPNVWIVLQ